MILSGFTTVASYIGYVLLAVLILLVMITVHEFGHYIAGKILGFGIEEFSIGFGPSIFKKKRKNGEVFAVRLIPLGGYCAFTGEDEDSTDERAFNNKSPWRRIIVLISGALMNYFLALVIIAIMFFSYGATFYVAYNVEPLTDGYTIENSLDKSDVILKIDGKDIYLVSDMMHSLDGKKEGDVADFYVIRDGKKQTVEVVLRSDCNFKNMEDYDTLYDSLGLSHEDGLAYTRAKMPFFQTIGRTFTYSFTLAGTIFRLLGQLLTGKLALTSFGGTITTVSYIAEAARIGGFSLVLEIAGLIGVNLALFNLLPIPALDGSRVVFTVIEWIRGKPVNRKIEGIVHTVGFILLLGFAVLVDLLQLFK